MVMSKNFFFIGLFFLLSFSTMAQSGISIHPGLEFQLNTKGSFLKPELILRKDKWELHPGILIGKRYLYSSYGGGAGISGLFFPVRCEAPLTFYFQGDLQRYMFRFESQVYEYKLHLTQGTLGYGFRIKIKGRLFLYQSVGLGALLQKQKTNFDGPVPAWAFRGAGVIKVGVSL